MNDEKVLFSFGWLALKLLGKSLYSNTWSAISELVANGFDANANNVYVYINIVDKKNAVVEIIDDGTGIDSESIETYVKVGFNKRENGKKVTPDNYKVMGRKGIGKLAALYLSENYYLLSKTINQTNQWKMVYKEDSNEDQKPFMQIAESPVIVDSSKIWNGIATGTLIRLNEVNLSGLGDIAFGALEKKLANIFSVDAMGERKIHLAVINEKDKPIDFKPIEKEIAFGNMAFIEYMTDESQEKIRKTLSETSEKIIKMPYTKVNGNQFYAHQIEVNTFDKQENIQAEGIYEYEDTKGDKQQKKYQITGWIGIHSTINTKQAEINDANFSKSKFYNPTQLRLYVRNKLAVENFLNYIENTQAFVNYIEGEIHFDLLDEDDMPDIATSNRQNLDEHDGRVQILIKEVSKIVSSLITKRNDLAQKIKDEENKIKTSQERNAKRQFSSEVESEIDGIKELKPEQKANITMMVTNKIKGDVVPKNEYLVFFSHASKDKRFTDFLYYLLVNRGLKKEEAFYTSRNDNPEKYENNKALAMQIKDNIIKKNVLLVYLTSKTYMGSQYCMFEGGAGWATRSVGEYIVMSLTYPEIPEFITNGKLEYTFEKKDKVALDRDTYTFLLKALNRIIGHINAGRVANAESIIELFEEKEIPNDLIISKEGKDIKDYMDSDIKEYWDFYVEKGANIENEDIDSYLKSRKNEKNDA